MLAKVMARAALELLFRHDTVQVSFAVVREPQKGMGQKTTYACTQFTPTHQLRYSGFRVML